MTSKIGLTAGILHGMDRQDFLYVRAPRCPECNTDQVQLIAGMEKPAQWKCRRCKHKFEFEPEAQHG